MDGVEHLHPQAAILPPVVRVPPQVPQPQLRRIGGVELREGGHPCSVGGAVGLLYPRAVHLRLVALTAKEAPTPPNTGTQLSIRHHGTSLRLLHPHDAGVTKVNHPHNFLAPLGADHYRHTCLRVGVLRDTLAHLAGLHEVGVAVKDGLGGDILPALLGHPLLSYLQLLPAKVVDVRPLRVEQDDDINRLQPGLQVQQHRVISLTGTLSGD